MTEETTAKPTTKRARKMAREPETNALQVGQGRAALTDSTVTKPPSKTALILGMLQRSEGAKLEQMVEATGWQPHTTRAALTGLRKKGHNITRSKIDDATRYNIVSIDAQ